ncbi:MAG: type II toxin-antitoxin system RelE/ParE family toxin [Planctomycetota bacterium]
MAKFTVQLADAAIQDAIDAVDWYAENYSEEFAARWYAGLLAAVASLRDTASGCSLVHENGRLTSDVRELLYGKSKRNRHRILLTIDGNTVSVVRIRHSAQRDLTDNDLERS